MATQAATIGRSLTPAGRALLGAFIVAAAFAWPGATPLEQPRAGVLYEVWVAGITPVEFSLALEVTGSDGPTVAIAQRACGGGPTLRPSGSYVAGEDSSFFYTKREFSDLPTKGNLAMGRAEEIAAALAGRYCDGAFSGGRIPHAVRGEVLAWPNSSRDSLKLDGTVHSQSLRVSGDAKWAGAWMAHYRDIVRPCVDLVGSGRPIAGAFEPRSADGAGTFALCISVTFQEAPNSNSTTVSRTQERG